MMTATKSGLRLMPRRYGGKNDNQHVLESRSGGPAAAGVVQARESSGTAREGTPVVRQAGGAAARPSSKCALKHARSRGQEYRRGGRGETGAGAREVSSRMQCQGERSA